MEFQIEIEERKGKEYGLYTVIYNDLFDEFRFIHSIFFKVIIKSVCD
jgi:hypothetical protein